MVDIICFLEDVLDARGSFYNRNLVHFFSGDLTARIESDGCRCRLTMEVLIQRPRVLHNMAVVSLRSLNGLG
jgi:hypothetical protein